MAFNNSGTWNEPAGNSCAPAVSGTTIESADFNALIDDIGSSLSNVICKDGQTTVTANLPMATYRHTGVGNATSTDQYASAIQVQNGMMTFDATETGTGDAYEITLSPSPSAYVAGQSFSFIASEANTGACSLNVNVLGVKSIKTQDGQDPANNVILANSVVVVTYDGTNFILISPVGGAIVGSLTGNVTGTILDSNGNEILESSATASAVAGFRITNAATGNPPIISVSSSVAGADIGMTLSDTNNNELLILTSVDSAVNEITVTNAASGNRPSINQTGSGDVGLDIEGITLLNGAITSTISSATITALNATNLLTYGEIGSFGYLQRTSSSTGLATGATSAGSNFYYASLYHTGTEYSVAVDLNVYPSGTWKIISGTSSLSSYSNRTYLAVRIS